MVYAYFDGDDISDTLEILLTENKIQEARSFSENLTEVMREIKNFLKENSNIEIVICGGDDLLVKFTASLHGRELLKNICQIFYVKTGHTMSCGVGESTSQSVRNLYLAKLYGKNRIVGLD